jgi:hypothetical protein
MTEILPELFLRERIAVPFELWLVLVVISLGLALFGLSSRSDEASQADARDTFELRLGNVEDLMRRMLASEGEKELKGHLSAKGFSEDQQGAYIAMAAITLQTLLSEDADKQTADGMIAFLVSRGISNELAITLLSAASRLLKERANAPAASAEPSDRLEGVCPNCSTNVPLEASECPNCKAMFGPDSAWQVSARR